MVIPLSTEHHAMLARNLLYTGLTRGKRLVCWSGSDRHSLSRQEPGRAPALVQAAGVAHGSNAAGETVFKTRAG